MPIFRSDKSTGQVTDLVSVPYAEGNSILAFLHTGYYHVHGAAFIYPDKAVPVTLTAGSGVWDLTGAKTEVIPVNTITKDFDLHWISVSDISATGYLVIDIYKGGAGAEVLLCSIDIFRSSNFIQEGARPIQVPQIPKNTRISCRLSDSTAGALTCAVKFSGHVYSASLV